MTLACGKAGWAPRRVEGRDIVSWLVETPFLEQTVDDLPSPLARLAANFQTTGRDRGRDLNYRTLLADGVTLTGRLLGCAETHDPLRGRSPRIGGVGRCPLRGHLQPVETGRAEPRRDASGPSRTAAAQGRPPGRDQRARISEPWCSRRAIARRTATGCSFPERSTTSASRSSATVPAPSCPGLYFIGTHFLRKRKSSTLFGMGEDAEIVAGTIAERMR